LRELKIRETKMGYKSVKRTSNSIEVFDHEHYHKVWKVRREIGDGLGNIEQKDHPLLGKTLINKETGKKYLVEKVNKQFYAGWYFGALLNCDNSHCFSYFQNESSIDDTIEESCVNFWERFELDK